MGPAPPCGATGVPEESGLKFRPAGFDGWGYGDFVWGNL